jgi:type I restriction enzyme S subunit
VPLIFAYYVLLSLGLDHMNADSAVPGLNRNTALSQRVPLPGRDDLASFSGLAETLVDRATAAAAENRVIGAIRDTLLPKLLSGELRVRDAGQLAEEAI